MGEKRDGNIDAVKGIAIILVVMGHICTGIPELVKWIYSFHMPLFFLISGYLQEGREYGRFIPYIKKKACTLLYPYYAFAALETLGTAMYVRSRDVINQTIISRVFGITTESNAIGPIWFLMVLFEVELLDYVIAKVGYKWIVLICGAIGSIFVIIALEIPFMLHLTFVGIVFFNIGKQLKKSYINFASSPNSECVLIVFFWILNVFSMMMNKRIDMYLFQYGNIVLFWVETISGSLAFIMSFLWIGKRYSWKWIDVIGKESLIIMAVHSYIHMIICIIGNRLLNIPLDSILHTGTISIVWSGTLVFLSYIIAKIIRRFFPILIKPIGLIKKE